MRYLCFMFWEKIRHKCICFAYVKENFFTRVRPYWVASTMNLWLMLIEMGFPPMLMDGSGWFESCQQCHPLEYSMNRRLLKCTFSAQYFFKRMKNCKNPNTNDFSNILTGINTSTIQCNINFYLENAAKMKLSAWNVKKPSQLLWIFVQIV